ncbi:hypothetical protein Tco_0541079, partial [Tanacetum coccineum]
KGRLKDDKGILIGLNIVDDLEKRIQNVEINLNKAKEKMLKEIGNSSFDLSREITTHDPDRVNSIFTELTGSTQ